MTGPFDPIFDLNKDGKMSAFEKGAEADYIERMTRETNRKNNRERETRKLDWRDKRIGHSSK